MCQTRSHYALAFPMIRVLVAVADRLCASAGPLCVSRGQEQDGSEALEIEQRLLAYRYHCCPEKMIHPELLSRLCRARDLLRDWEDEHPSVIAVARASGLTHFHFIRLFKAVFGETPHQYRSRAQIEKAKHLLILTDLSITDVCMAVGFSSLGSFSALFSRRVGMSPSEFQRRYRPASLPERQLPASLSPGCLSLMAGISEKEQFSRRQPVDDADTV